MQRFNAATNVACMLIAEHPDLIGTPVPTLGRELPGVIDIPIRVQSAPECHLAEIWTSARPAPYEMFPFSVHVQQATSRESYRRTVARTRHGLPLAGLGLVGDSLLTAAPPLSRRRAMR